MSPMKWTMILAVALAAGCTKSGDDGGDMHDHHEMAEAATNRIDIPPTVRSNLGMTFAKVERREVAGTIRVPGAFELQPLARHEYRMTLPGHIELLVDQYDEVKPGDVLYRFRSPQWPELQHEIIAAELAMNSAEAEIDVAGEKITEARARLAQMRERLEALASADFRQAELEAQVADVEASVPRLEAELRRAETMLANAKRSREHALDRASSATGFSATQLAQETSHDGRTVPAYHAISWIEVRATEAGVVQALQITDGAYVEPPSMVVATINPDRIRFRALGLQSDLPRFSDGATARIVPPCTPGLEINDALPARLTIGLEADPDQRTVTLLATSDERRTWTRPGVSAFLEIQTESTDGPALAIPRSAVVKDGVTHVFFRRDPQDPSKAIRVEADLGASDGRWIAVKSGLMLGDEVVLDGAYELKLASQQGGGAQKGGHFHADGTFHGDDH
jgi:multidrug efflux pump subunit AcrA (membrane-fusion protein)